MIKTIYDKLKAKGLNPYFVGQHQGLCTNNHVVVKQGTQIPSIQSNKLGQMVVDIIIFVPEKSYVKLDPYVKEIRLALKDISSLRKTGFETPAITDEDKKAYTISIEYVLQKKLEG